MNPAEYNALHILHVIGLIVLTGYTFYAFAAPPDSRKRVMMITGIATLVVVLTGIRMWQGMFSFEVTGWILIKAVCWLGLSGLAGMAYRRREKVRGLTWALLGLASVAVAMVYLKPF